MKLLCEQRFTAIALVPGDSIKFTYKLYDGMRLIKTLFSHVEAIEKPIIHNVCRVYQADSFDGMADVYMLAAGYIDE